MSTPDIFFFFALGEGPLVKTVLSVHNMLVHVQLILLKFEPCLIIVCEL